MDAIEHAWEKLRDTTGVEKLNAFLEYCDLCVSEKEGALGREEEVAYKICGAISLDELDQYPLAESVIEHACDMEIPRETKWGTGLRLDEDWTQEKADAYKKKEYEELVAKIEELRKGGRSLL